MARIRHIYLFKTDNNMYKIGVADSPKKRLKGVQTGCPTKVEIVFIKQTYKALKVEALLHKMFDKNRVMGEWFKFTDDEVEDVILEIRKNTIKPKHQVDLSHLKLGA